MTKLKIIASILVLAGALWQVYNIYVNGVEYNRVVPRDSRGFIIDATKVKVTAKPDAVEAYKKLISGGLIKKVDSEIARAERAQLEQLKKIEDLEDQLPKTNLPNPQDDQSDLASQTMPPPPPPLPQQNPENVNLPAENMPQGESLPELDEVSDSNQNEQSNEESMGAASNNLDENPKNNSGTKVDSNNNKSEFDPVKELAARNLMSCKTKNSKGLIPVLIWNYIVNNAKATEYTTTGDETLPEIAQKLLDDESCWPKLWSQNPQLESPYEIPAGLKINILPESSRLPANSPGE